MVKVKIKSKNTTEKVFYYALTLYAAAISIMFLIAFSTAIYKLVKDPSQVDKASYGLLDHKADFNSKKGGSFE